MKKYKKATIIFILILAFISLYVLRNHLGYFVYLYSHVFNVQTSELEDKLQLVLRDNPTQLFTEFKKELELFPKNANVCHGIAHKLGHKSYDLYGFEKSMQIAEPYCAAGFIHGIIEAQFGELRDTKALNGISGICDEKDEKCNHGIGHGLMVLTKNKFQEALVYCDTLHPLAHSDCYDGVFMHVFDNEETGISKNIPERQEGISLCARVEDVYKKSCYFYLPRIFAGDIDMNIKSKGLCEKTVGDNLKVCIVGTGTMIGKYVYDDPEKAKTLCGIFDKEVLLCNEGINMYRNKTF